MPMTFKKSAAAAAFALFAALGLSACEEEGPAEQAGEAVDESVEQTGEAMEEAGEELEDATN